LLVAPIPQTGNKKAALGRLFLYLRVGLSASEGFDPSIQAALVAGSLVLVDDALVDHAVDDWHGILVGCRGSIFVAGITGLDDILDFGAQKGAQTHIVLTGLLRLAGALPS